MKKLSCVIIATLAALAFLVVSAPATAGDLDELTGLFGGGDQGAAPTADKPKRAGGGGVAKASKLEERIKALEELLAKQPKPGEINDANIYDFLIPIYAVVGIIAIFCIIALVLSIGLRVEVRGFKAKVEVLEDAVTELKDDLDNKADKVTSAPPPAPAPGP